MGKVKQRATRIRMDYLRERTSEIMGKIRPSVIRPREVFKGDKRPWDTSIFGSANWSRNGRSNKKPRRHVLLD